MAEENSSTASVEAGAPERDDILRLRLLYMLNDYVPLPSRGKAKPIYGWQKVDVTPETLRKWHRSLNLKTTCLRVQPPLAVADIDVNDPISKEMRGLFFQIVGEGAQLVRYGNGHKLAIFATSDQSFTRMATRRFLRPGEKVETVEGGRCRIVALDGTIVKGGGQQVEAFGGKSARYFGAAGPHSHLADGSVAVKYCWEGQSPEDTPIASLPMVSTGQWREFLDRCEALMLSRGWTAIPLAQIGENGGGKPGANPWASPEKLAKALAFIPAFESYEDWNRVGMAIYRATSGSAEGFAVWDSWSRKATNYGGTIEKWDAYERSRPTILGAGTIFYLADIADPMWRRRSEEKLFEETLVAYRARFGAPSGSRGPNG